MVKCCTVLRPAPPSHGLPRRIANGKCCYDLLYKIWLRIANGILAARFAMRVVVGLTPKMLLIYEMRSFRWNV